MRAISAANLFANLGTPHSHPPLVLSHQPSHSCTVCAECFAASAALHRATPNVQFSEKPFCLQPRRVESLQVRGAHALSRAALCLLRVRRARQLASAAHF
jgi:hypothetical protein